MIPSYDEIDIKTARSNYSSIKHGAHVLIWARTETRLFGKHPMRALALMTLRFDGTFGFPGGYIDDGETIEEGLSRELREEIGLDPAQLVITPEDQLCSHLVTNHHGHQGSNLCLHFFVKEVTEEFYLSIEKNILGAAEYGLETLGITRVPLYTLSNERGFPGFLKNSFVGNSKEQLIKALEFAKMMPTEFQKKTE